MDFTALDKISDKLYFLFSHISELKEENKELKRRIYALELNLSQVKAASVSQREMQDLKTKYSSLVKEYDELVMQKELIRKKVDGMIERLDEILDEEGSAD